MFPCYSDSSVDKKSKEEMPIIDKKLGLPLSHESSSFVSIANSERNFKAKQALSHDLLADSSSRGNTEAYYEDDDELRYSDASSQFSFVKDIRGGRNTSVKYYKTKSSMKADGGLKPGFSQVDDMGYEVEALSDYDFENNGMDGDEGLEDGGYDDFEGANRYDDFLDTDDHQSTPFQPSKLIGSESTPFEDKSDDNYDEHNLEDTANSTAAENFQIMSDSTYLSEPEPPFFSFVQSREATPEMKMSLSGQNYSSPGEEFTDDLLDSYFERSRLPNTITPSSQKMLCRSPFESMLEEFPSPLLNGVTFGSEQRFRSQRNSRKLLQQQPRTAVNGEKEELGEVPDIGLGIVSAQTNNRLSIANMMDLLGSLEQSAAEDLKLKEAKIQDMKSLFQELGKQSCQEKPSMPKRSLIINMMNTLADLETALDVPTEEKKKKARNSIADMMKTLAALEKESDEQYWPPKQENSWRQEIDTTRTAEECPRRTSLCSSKESLKPKPDIFISQSPEDIINDQNNSQLDEDLLDEINQLPEDYDFENQGSHLEVCQVPDFFRSNSYNKKPQKVILDNCYQKNKIETSQKTVTFYRTGSIGHSDSLHRADSERSATSFNSFQEEEEDEKEKLKPKTFPYSIHQNSHLFENSNDSVSHKSFNLEPITEDDSPIIK